MTSIPTNPPAFPRLAGATEPITYARPKPISPAAPSPGTPGTPGAAAPQILRPVQRLVAAAVPGGIRFDHDGPRPANTLPLYNHPAQRNAAATAVSAGRLIDVTG